MNNPHHGARLPVHCREQIGARVTAGQSAAAFAVSARTVCKWPERFRAGGSAPPDRVSGFTNKTEICEAIIVQALERALAHMTRRLDDLSDPAGARPDGPGAGAAAGCGTGAIRAGVRPGRDPTRHTGRRRSRNLSV